MCTYGLGTHAPPSTSLPNSSSKFPSPNIAANASDGAPLHEQPDVIWNLRANGACQQHKSVPTDCA
eukprot:5805165-Alexandrium_andersonii.AAC.2